MATRGPKIVLTPEEKIEFNPLFLKYVKKECDAEQILAEFKGNKSKFSRFEFYTNQLIKLLQTQAIEKQIAEVTKSKTLLTKGIEKHRSNIAQSRTAVKASLRQAIRI